METIHKCQAVLIPIDKPEYGCIIQHSENEKYQIITNKNFDNTNAKVLVLTKWNRFYHLYILSDEEIKDGDWVIFNNKQHKIQKTNILYNGNFDLQVDENAFLSSELCKKIIASNDPDTTYLMGRFGVPRPTDVFIKQWIAKGCPEFVNVEYEEYIVQPYFQDKKQYNDFRLKLSENIITCSFIKDT